MAGKDQWFRGGFFWIIIIIIIILLFVPGIIVFDK